MKYIMIFHANLNYAYLTPDRYEFVIRHSYELIFDTMRERFPTTPYVFEASGYTLEQIGQRTPDVLEKLKEALERGQCEFMGSPYAHPMLPNFPKEDGRWSLHFALESYQRLLGMRPKSCWNPECGWRGYIPELVSEAGYKNLLGDFEAYSRSCGPDGRPLRPEIYQKEYRREPAFYDFGFNYDLPGDERAIHFPFNRPADLKPGALRIFLRTDRIAQFGVRYFMGMEGYSFDEYIALIKKYAQQPPDEPEGALIIFADDAEYVGTNGWFRLKYQNMPDHVFEATCESKQKLIKLVAAGQKLGGFITFEQACEQLPPLEDIITFDDDSAWHGARASTWAATPIARLLRPWQDLVRKKLLQISEQLAPREREQVWYHLTNSYNSDGQWPPTLPHAPHIVHPFNYRYCFENLLQAELLVDGVDRRQLDTDPAQTLTEILHPQQELVLRKVQAMLQSSNPAEQEQARAAQNLILQTQNVASVRASRTKILYPAEYAVRAEALIAARRLVGGVEIEKG